VQRYTKQAPSILLQLHWLDRIIHQRNTLNRSVEDREYLIAATAAANNKMAGDEKSTVLIRCCDSQLAVVNAIMRTEISRLYAEQLSQHYWKSWPMLPPWFWMLLTARDAV